MASVLNGCIGGESQARDNLPEQCRPLVLVSCPVSPQPNVILPPLSVLIGRFILHSLTPLPSVLLLLLILLGLILPLCIRPVTNPQ